MSIRCYYTDSYTTEFSAVITEVLQNESGNFVILDKTFESTEFEELRAKPVFAITGVSETDAQLLKRAFNVDTIQDLAENKFVCIAQTIIALAFLEDLISEL